MIIFHCTGNLLICACLCCPPSSTVPPTVSVSGSGLLQATKGQTITLSFLIINSNPPVSPSGIMWEFLFISDTAETVVIDDGTRYAFSPDRTSLTIANLGPMDSGTYTLTAINSAGSSATFIQLSVSGEMINYYSLIPSL